LPVARYGVRWFARKYELDIENTEPARVAVVELLDALRAVLARSSYVSSGFSFADIIMATFLQGVVPVADRYIHLGPATWQVFTQSDLAPCYSDLIQWRDRMYVQRRAPLEPAQLTDGPPPANLTNFG